GIGIVLGSSLGDTVVSQANKDIAASLRADLTKARADAGDARDAVSQRERLIDGLFSKLAGGKLKGRRVALVGSGDLGQTPETDPSQISFYSNQGLSSVDDVDTAGGRLALVLALAGARGNFGFKKTADRSLPKLDGSNPTP